MRPRQFGIRDADAAGQWSLPSRARRPLPPAALCPAPRVTGRAAGGRFPSSFEAGSKARVTPRAAAASAVTGGRDTNAAAQLGTPSLKHRAENYRASNLSPILLRAKHGTPAQLEVTREGDSPAQFEWPVYMGRYSLSRRFAAASSKRAAGVRSGSDHFRPMRSLATICNMKDIDRK